MTTVTSRTDITTQPQIQNDQTADVGAVVAPKTGQVSPGLMGNYTLPPAMKEKLDRLIDMTRTMAPPEPGSDFEVLLAQVVSTLKEVTGKAEQSRADNEMASKKLQIQENQAKIEESKKKLDEAEAKKNSSNIFDILKMVFEALAAIAQMVLGAVLSILGGAGGMLIATGAIMLAMMINNAVAKANDGAGILGSIVKAAGGDDKAVAAADGVFMAAMIVGLIVTIAKNPVGNMKELMGAFAAMAVKVSQAALAATDAGMQVGSAGMKFEAAKATESAKKSQADSKEIEALMQQLDDMIDMALTLLMQVNQNVNQMMDSFAQMLNDAGDTMSNTKFAG